MAKSATGLVSFVQQALRAGTGYVYGTFGQICTEDLLDRKAAQYPDDDLAGGTMRRVGNKWRGRRVVDCIGLIKYYLWADNYGDDPDYNPAQDHSANQHYNEAREYGPIGTLPEIPGLLLHMDGHVGVYVGGGYAIEAAGTVEGVIRTRIAGRGWDHWYKSIWLDYSASGEAPDGAVYRTDTTGCYRFTRGSTYRLRVTCTSGRPHIVTGTDGVCSIALHSHSGNDYYYDLHGIGQPDQATGIYINRGKTSALVVRIVSACKCDTGGTLIRHPGECYTIGLTAADKPVVKAGTDGPVTVAGVYADNSGTDKWLAPIVAVRPGTTGIYVQAPSETGTRRFIVKVVE